MAAERPKDLTVYVMIPRFNYREMHTFRGDIMCGEVMQLVLNTCYLPVDNGKDGRIPITVILPQIKSEMKFLFHPADIFADVKKILSACLRIPADVMAKHNLVVDVPGWKQFKLEDHRSFQSYGLEANKEIILAWDTGEMLPNAPKIDPYVFKGWMDYRKGKGSYKKRWVELKDNSLTMYKSEDKKSVDKTLMLDPLTLVDFEKADSDKKLNAFVVQLDATSNEKDKEKSYYFYAETKVKTQEWITHIRIARHRVENDDTIKEQAAAGRRHFEIDEKEEAVGDGPKLRRPDVPGMAAAWGLFVKDPDNYGEQLLLDPSEELRAYCMEEEGAITLKLKTPVNKVAPPKAENKSKFKNLNEIRDLYPTAPQAVTVESTDSASMKSAIKIGGVPVVGGADERPTPVIVTNGDVTVSPNADVSTPLSDGTPTPATLLCLTAIGADSPLSGSVFYVGAQGAKIGRSRARLCNIIVPGSAAHPMGDDAVSKEHCQILYDSGRYWVRTVSARNFCLVKVPSQGQSFVLYYDEFRALKEGDTIQVGSRTVLECSMVPYKATLPILAPARPPAISSALADRIQAEDKRATVNMRETARFMPPAELSFPRPVVVSDSADDESATVLGEVIVDVTTTLGDMRKMIGTEILEGNTEFEMSKGIIPLKRAQDNKLAKDFFRREADRVVVLLKAGQGSEPQH